MEHSLELIQDYVIVSGPSMDVSSHSTCNSKPSNDKYQDPLQTSANTTNPSSAVESIDGATDINTHRTGSFNCYGSTSGTSLESVDLRDVFPKPSTHCMARIKSLQQCASAIKELVNEKASHCMNYFLTTQKHILEGNFKTLRREYIVDDPNIIGF